MGRATITSEAGDGRYTIEVDFGAAEKARRLDRVAMRLYELGLRKTWQTDILTDLEDGLPSLQAELDALIAAYVAASKAVPRDAQNEAAIKKQIDAKTADIAKQRTLILQARNALSLTELQIKAAELERGTLEQLSVTATQGAWCADLTEQASGAVATLEIPGESDLILIKPGAPAPVAADGALVAREMQTPEQVFWNAAVLPGWQKHLPTYRWGTITAINLGSDTCDLDLAPARSSAQGLDVNQSTALADVPVVYMTCNAAAFEIGSRVVVEFINQDWTRPRVIGFMDNPRACGGAGLYCIPASNTAPYGWSPPTTDGTGAPINGGKGIVAVLGDALAPPGALRDGTNRTAGTLASVTAGGLGTRTLRGVRADAQGVPASGPTEIGNDNDPMSFSSFGRMSFEWVSKTGAIIATAFDTCRVNGRNIGRPALGTPYRVFVPATTVTAGTPTAFCVTAQGSTFRLYSRPLAGDSLLAWTFVAQYDVGTLTPALAAEDLRRIITNDDGSVVTLWFSDGGLIGYGCIDFAIPDGAVTWTPAVITFASNLDSETGAFTNTFSTQISVDYVDNAKAFATLNGTKTDERVTTEFSEYGHIEEIVTADFWGVEVTVSHFLSDLESTQEPWTDGDGSERLRSDLARYASMQSRQIYFFGGAGDPILFTFKHYERTKIYSVHFDDNYLAGMCSPGDTACFVVEGRDEQWTIPAISYGTGMIHNGVETTFSALARPAFDARRQLENTYTLPAKAGGSFSRFYATWAPSDWNRISRLSPGGGYWPEVYGTFADVARKFGTLFVPSTPHPFLGAGYHWTATGLQNINIRCFNGFAILSNPLAIENELEFTTSVDPGYGLNWPVRNYPMPADAEIVIDPTQWQTWCSDPAALARYALDLSMTPGPNRLKYLQLGSPS